jgi:hydroxymethylpyrimidine/phosphomethylpyrimidine kinase
MIVANYRYKTAHFTLLRLLAGAIVVSNFIDYYRSTNAQTPKLYMPASKPIILTISGHDPSGGAGVLADADVFLRHGCHLCSVLTCLTVQDSSSVYKLTPLNADDMLEQATALFNDFPIAAIKIGLTGSVGCIETIIKILKQHSNIPVIFDPVLASGDGAPLSNQALIDTIKRQLIPLCTVITPNSIEAHLLTDPFNDYNIKTAGLALLKTGVDYVLITGGHEDGDTICNQTFHNNEIIQQLNWSRLPGEFHGTGCTLASAISAQIALGKNIPDAIEKAQAYTDAAIRNAYKPGKGQFFLSR